MKTNFKKAIKAWDANYEKEEMVYNKSAIKKLEDLPNAMEIRSKISTYFRMIGEDPSMYTLVMRYAYLIAHRNEHMDFFLLNETEMRAIIAMKKGNQNENK